MTDIANIEHSHSRAAEGRRLIAGNTAYYPPAIKHADLVLADFDAKAVRGGGGLYLVEEVLAGRVTWTGCRRFDIRPEGLAVDISGDGNWHSIDLAAVSWRIAAEVCQVFKPSI